MNMMIGIIITILVVISLTFIYTTYNLFKKNEKCEEIIISYDKQLLILYEQVKETNNKIKEIDSRGSFNSDDEIGFFFKYVSKMQEQIYNFYINIYGQEEKQK